MPQRKKQSNQKTLDSLNPKNFKKLHSFIKPRKEELRWTEIPWKINLWEARQKASLAESTPIHLGHEWQSAWMYLKQWYYGPCVHIFTP